MTKSNGKAALITGSTDGVGRVVAKRLRYRRSWKAKAGSISTASAKRADAQAYDADARRQLKVLSIKLDGSINELFSA